MAIDKLGHIKAQIAMHSGRLRPKIEHNAIKVCCPFHGGGNERTPSCSVKTTGNLGVFHCFGCHESGGWNKLALATGMQGFKKSDLVNDVYSFVIPEQNYSERTPPGLEDIESLKPAKLRDGWRGITIDTLRLFNARFPKHEYYNQNDFIYFPVLNNKKYVGGVYARREVTKEGKDAGLLSYINTKGVWTKHSLFGYNLARKRRGPLWYVEGPRDCMKLAQLGARVVAGLGSYVGEHKIRLIEALDPPFVIIGTDPDEAGIKARAFIKEHLPMIPIVDAIFPEGRDPGNLTERSYIKMMRRLGIDHEQYERVKDSA